MPPGSSALNVDFGHEGGKENPICCYFLKRDESCRFRPQCQKGMKAVPVRMNYSDMWALEE